jgi:hypothetical protein
MMNRRLAFALAVGLGLSGCGPRPDPRVVSPDGRRIVTASVNRNKADGTKYLCVRIKIADAAGHVEFEEQTGASVVMRWSVAWSGNDTVVLRSSDIGPSGWRVGPDGTWKALTATDPALVEKK